MSADEKWCPRCETAKVVDDFHRDRARADGRQLWCKDCCRERDRARPRQRPTVRRVLRTRANNRALAALRDRHRAEFDALYDDCLASVIEQAEAWQASRPQDDGHGPVTPMLKPGPAVPGEDPETRLLPNGLPGSCALCRSRHDKGHVCPICGSKPQVAISTAPRPAPRRDKEAAGDDEPGDPSDASTLDEAVVSRLLHGERVKASIPERREAAQILTGRGLSASAVAARLHITSRTVVRYRREDTTHATEVA